VVFSSKNNTQKDNLAKHDWNGCKKCGFVTRRTP
jgi:hypothetical protein